MKAKSVTFRPRKDLAERLEKLAEISERSKTWIIEKCVEGHLPALEHRYLMSGDIQQGNASALATAAGETKAGTKYVIRPAAASFNDTPRKRK